MAADFSQQKPTQVPGAAFLEELCLLDASLLWKQAIYPAGAGQGVVELLPLVLREEHRNERQGFCGEKVDQSRSQINQVGALLYARCDEQPLIADLLQAKVLDLRIERIEDLLF
jgi:hypothetical protein